MKLIRFEHDNKVKCGILTDNGIAAIDSAKTMLEIIQNAKDFSQKPKNSDKLINIEDVKILAPIAKPGKILALAGNYKKHIAEASQKRGFKLGLSDSQRDNTTPRPFMMPSTCITGPDTIIEWPGYSKEIDYEVELAVVIGEKIKCVQPDRAQNAVFGYMIANDVSARSVTFKEKRNPRPWDDFYDWLNGKWADGFCPTGPFILTADEIKDVHALEIELKVNGQTRQKANTAEMIYSVYETISFISHITTLEPGDIILTGTPSGVGVATGNFLKQGDVIECTIEDLGALTNTISPKPDVFYEPLS